MVIPIVAIAIHGIHYMYKLYQQTLATWAAAVSAAVNIAVCLLLLLWPIRAAV